MQLKPIFMTSTTGPLWRQEVQVQPQDQIKAEFNVFSQSTAIELVATELAGPYRQINFDQKSFKELGVAYTEQSENILMYGCWKGNRETSKIIGTPEFLNKTFNVEADINTSLIRLKLKGPYDEDYIMPDAKKWHEGLGGWGTKITETHVDNWSWSVEFNRMNNNKNSIVILDKRDPYKKPFENTHTDYFMGTWQARSKTGEIRDPYFHMIGLLEQLNYKKETVDDIRSIWEGMKNALQHGCWDGVLDEDKVKNGDLNKVITLSWRINQRYAQFIISDPGQGFNPLNIPLPIQVKTETSPADLLNRGHGMYILRGNMDDIIYNFPVDEHGKSLGTQLILGKENK